MKRVITIAIAIAIMLVTIVLPSCKTASTTKGTKPITACVGPEPKSIDPAINQAVDGATYLVHAFEGLTKTDKNNQIVAGMAQKWDISTDGLTYTFHLRTDAKWSDGVAVKASDFVYAWQRAANPVTASPYAYQLYYINNAAEINSQFVGKDSKPAKAKLGADGKPAKFKYDDTKKVFVKDAAGKYIADEAGQYVEDATGNYVNVNADGTPTWLDNLGVKATDDKTLVVTLAGPCSYILQITAFPTLFPVRKDIVEKNPDTWANDPSTYIGNGPYNLTKWEHNSKMTFTKSQTYYAKDTIVSNEIDFLLMSDQNAMLNAYKNGQLLLSEDAPTDEIPALKASGDLTIYGNLGISYYVFNVNKKPFDNVKVREALTLAIDRQYLVEKILKAGQLPAGAFVPLQIPDAVAGKDFRTVGGDYFDPTTKGLAANLVKAKQALSDAGYPNGQDFPTVELKFNTGDANQKMAEYIVNEWKVNLGINITIQAEEWNVFIADRNAGNYSIGRDAWIGDYVDPMTFLDLYTSTSGNNDAHWKNTAFDKLIDTAKKSSVQSARMTAMHSAEDLIMKDFAAMPIYYYTDPDLVSKNLKGYVHSALGYKYLMWAYVQ